MRFYFQFNALQDEVYWDFTVARMYWQIPFTNIPAGSEEGRIGISTIVGHSIQKYSSEYRTKLILIHNQMITCKKL